jgi:GNAT superfamily N-acetyltransferase
MPCDGPIHLRRALPADAAGIAEVHVRGWKSRHADLVPPECLARLDAARREESWRGELAVSAPDRRPWVALVDDRIVGFASTGISRDDDAATGSGEVYDLYVDPDCWGRGIGHNLVTHATRDLVEHGFATASTWVLRDFQPAHQLFGEFGWHPDGATRAEDCGEVQVVQVRLSRRLG